MLIRIKIKEEYADNDFNKFREKLPADYILTFSLLWNDFVNLDDIVMLSNQDFENAIRRYKKPIQEDMRTIFYQGSQELGKPLKDLLVENFYRVISTRLNGDSTVTYEVITE